MRTLTTPLATPIALLCLCAAGCASTQPKDDAAANDKNASLEVEVTDSSEVERYDLNGDGKADVTSIFAMIGGGEENSNAEKRRVLARKEIDVNFDSKVDVRQFFTDAGDLLREEMDLDFDGKTDAIDYYAKGVRTSREMFLNFVEQPSMWKFYEDGKLIRSEQDTKGDGKADEFVYYDGAGKVVRIGYDTSGNGKPDRYENFGDEEEAE